MADKIYSSEQRRFKRIKINLSVVFRLARPAAIRLLVGNKEVRATMLDLSEGGLSVLTNYDIPKSTALLIKFTLFKVENDDVSFYGPMEIIGEVRYNMPLGGNEYRLGIYYKKIKNQDKIEIANFLKLKAAMHLTP
ncbi:MAG: PilZ domain-containing protein [Candidatus Omnitrophica bacterium]|nr:PilZ domain-containing protein [Candidatus Omnitrophota bacterium]